MPLEEQYPLLVLAVWVVGVIVSAAGFVYVEDDEAAHPLAMFALFWPFLLAVIVVFLPVGIGVFIGKWMNRKRPA